jgi:hypothetical protein
MTAAPWRPPTVETGVLETAVLAAVRHAILPINGAGQQVPDADGITRRALPDGRDLQLVVTVQPAGGGDLHGRAVVRYHVGGQGMVQATAFLIEGEAALDRATRAFLELSVRLSGVAQR